MMAHRKPNPKGCLLYVPIAMLLLLLGWHYRDGHETPEAGCGDCPPGCRECCGDRACCDCYTHPFMPASELDIEPDVAIVVNG